MLSSSRRRKARNITFLRRILMGGALGGFALHGVTGFAQETQYPTGSSMPIQRSGVQLPPLPSVPNQGGNPAFGAVAPAQQAQPTQSTRLQVYNIPSQLIGTIGAQLQILHHDDAAVRISTEPSTGRLLVMATDQLHGQISQEISTLLKQHVAPDGNATTVAAFSQQVYHLQNLSWREMEDALKQLGGTRITVTTERNGEVANLRVANGSGSQDVLQIDRRENTLTLVGSGQEINGWAQVARSLDLGQGDARRSTHVVPMSPAEPRKIKQAFRLVSATMQEDAGGGEAEAQVSVDGSAQATAMGTLDDLGSGSGLFGDVQIEFIEEIDLVIIRGSKDDVKRTLEVIEKIKQQADQTQPEIKVYTLKHANAQAVETLVEELYETVYLPRQGSVSITALSQPNSLLIIGREEVVASVEELIQKIDQPLEPEHQLKVRRLEFASAVDVQERIREFFVEYPGQQDEVRAALGSRAKVVADYRTNSLIIQAAPREMLELEKLIRELDVEGTQAESEVRVFKLKNTLSDDLQAVIEEVIGGQGTGGDTALATPPSGVLSFQGTDGQTVESGILAGVIVTSDPSTNALIVRAPSQSMYLIDQLIKELDQLPSAEARIKVFEVKNGDATSLAQLLQQLYGLQVTAGQSTTGGLFGLGTLQQAALTAGGESSLVQLRVTPDVRTNSIIVSGSASDLEVIEALLYRLDEDGVENRRTNVIWLRNGNAEAIALALNQYLQQQRQVNQLLVTTNQAISVLDQADREVFIVAEPETNSIVISATPRYYDTIIEVIERLDRRPPLVAIQVMIAEVLLTDELEFGAEWGIQDGLVFDRQSATGGTLSSPVFNLGTPLTGPSGGVGQTQNVAGQALSNFALGRTNSESIGGLVLSASSEAVGVLVRALQTAGRLQVLSRPHLTTLDGRIATTLVGQQVPRVQGVTQGGVGIGQTINAVDVPVGLGLQVVPRVNQDGLIVMEVQIQNSSVGDADSGIPVGFGPNGEVIRSPIINTIEAATTVSAYSGQTVVFAGLIRKQRETARRQIPILGSLPLIGAAFRYDLESEQRAELLVVMTPRIIQTDEDYEMIKQIESSRMSWCLADVLNIHGDVGLSGGNGLWGPAKSPVIYPDMQPTVIDDRSSPGAGRPQQFPSVLDNYQNPYQEEFQGQEIQGIIEPAIPMPTDTGQTSSRNDSAVRSIGFQQPVQGNAYGNQSVAPQKTY